MTPEANSKLKLAFLLLITFLPITLASIYFRIVDDGTLATANHGTLIRPPADITALGMRDASGDTQFRRFEDMIAEIDEENYQPQPWLMVFVTGRACEEACQERIHFLKQLHTLLAGDAPRVRRYYLHASDEPLSAEIQTLFRETYPSMGIAFTDREVLEQNMVDAGVPMDLDTENYVLLVDPVGNVMMYYTSEQTHAEIMEDLEHLLKYSSLG